jgi:FKBP-type peptidyl-prolyl cis-trans isomerase
MEATNIQKQLVKGGNGGNPPQMSTVHVHYTGKFANGQIFDSSLNRGQPFTFKLGAGQVIRGWDIAVSGMQQGEKSIFFIPSFLAYGPHGAGGVIPPNTDLFFEIELLGWN